MPRVVAKASGGAARASGSCAASSAFRRAQSSRARRKLEAHFDHALRRCEIAQAQPRAVQCAAEHVVDHRGERREPLGLVALAREGAREQALRRRVVRTLAEFDALEQPVQEAAVARTAREARTGCNRCASSCAALASAASSGWRNSCAARASAWRVSAE
jgi:hypothetical protein